MLRQSHSSNSSISLALLGSLLGGLMGLAQAQAQTPSAEPAGDDTLLLACHQMAACKSQLDKATESYRQNHYDDAISAYKSTYALQPYPPILYNIARLYHKKNNLSEAIAYYQKYLSSGHPAQVERARKFHSEARQELEAQDSQAEPPPAPLLSEPPLLVTTQPVLTASRPQKPLYQKWWLWTLVGVATAGAATAIGIGVYASGPTVAGLPMQTASLQH